VYAQRRVNLHKNGLLWVFIINISYNADKKLLRYCFLCKLIDSISIGGPAIRQMKILIAEDEQDIAFLYKEALEERNHAVVLAKNGMECLDIYKQEIIKYSIAKEQDEDSYNIQKKDEKSEFHNDSCVFDVVIIDYKMPIIDGLQAAKEILNINPHQRIIFASAYVKESLQDSIRELKQVVELLQKPFDIDTLVDQIEDKEVYEGLKVLTANILDACRHKEDLKDIDPTDEQIEKIFGALRKIQKGIPF
jgi:CheY-like chemotaxis protein